MPAYNVDSYIAEAIDGILAQSYHDFELLICDDGSRDRTVEIVKRYTDPRVNFLQNDQNLGKTATVNKLFSLSKGSLVTIHDSDDASFPTRFDKQVSLLAERPDILACGSSFEYVDRDGNHLQTYHAPTDPSVAYKGGLHGPTLVIRRKVLEHFGLVYRPFFKDYNEDVDLWKRIRDLGPIVGHPDVLYKYRLTPGSLSRSLTPHKRVVSAITDLLAEQRELRENHLDDLMLGEVQKVESLYLELLQPYDNDPALIWRENAGLNLYYGFSRESISASFKAIQMRWWDHRNLRTLIYVLRKLLAAEVKKRFGRK